MSSRGESRETSIAIAGRSSGSMGLKRESSRAALAAHRAMLSPRRSFAWTTPMQPRNFLATCRVTNTPQWGSKSSVWGIFSNGRLRQTASTTAWRAKSRMFFRSDSERESILRFLLNFHHIELAALLDTIVQLAPEPVKILRGGNQRADHHQPEKNQPQCLQRSVPGAINQNRRGAHLQNHLRFAKSRGSNREAFGR